ncbi:MAG: DNA adenine methylase, partial [Chloroflexi bacterium]|nr:DNA adenine methylase [Chloroflexota bacterium]
MANKKIAFGWYGGKYSHLNWLLPLLPYTTHYCEPFGGSAAVIINRNPSPVETYN